MTYVILSNKKSELLKKILGNGLFGLKKRRVCEKKHAAVQDDAVGFGGFLRNEVYDTVILIGRRTLYDPRNANANNDWY